MLSPLGPPEAVLAPRSHGNPIQNRTQDLPNYLTLLHPNPNHPPMKYNIRKTTRNTAILAFEAFHSPEFRPPEIKRYLPKIRDFVAATTGDVLGLQENKPCALIIEVRIYDLITIRDTHPQSGHSRYTNFRIDRNFLPVRLAIPDRCLRLTGYDKLLWVNRAVDFIPQTRDQRMRVFFSRKHPKWLQRIADRQLTEWRRMDADKYFNYAPIHKVARYIKRLPEMAPYAALARFKSYLSPQQLAKCIRHSPGGAVTYAMDDIPPLAREDYLVNNAKEALEFAADKLTDHELGIVSRIEMFTAMSRRYRMSGRRRAIMLASSYCMCFVAGNAEPLPALRNEIRKSLLAFPAEWRASDPYGFPSILRGLQTYVKMGFDYNLILALMATVGPQERQELAGIVAGMI